ncbi:MAG: MarR family transcriptional regulator [Candidatus Hydrogenedentes bacterium]|nr:MarR family transcriptional regulator [Candidatus Hydrogenedentota bacterium]
MSLAAELNLDIPFSDLRHETVLNIIHTANTLAALGARLFRGFDLTEAQFNVLFSLKHKNVKITQSDLGKRLVVTRASITSVLDKLQEKGLIERVIVPGNRRIHHVELTVKGRRLIDKIEPHYRQALQTVMSGLTEAECRELISLLERVRTTSRAQ